MVLAVTKIVFIDIFQMINGGWSCKTLLHRTAMQVGPAETAGPTLVCFYYSQAVSTSPPTAAENLRQTC